MQRPMLEEVSTFSQFIQSCSEIENKMREYISDSLELGKEFRDEFRDGPWERGFKRLSKFLKEREKIDKELYEDILIIRNKRRRLFLDADYNNLTYYTDLARNILKRLNKQIGGTDQVQNVNLTQVHCKWTGLWEKIGVLLDWKWIKIKPKKFSNI